MKRTIYIYGLYDPRTDEIRYVGKTTHPSRRLWFHINKYESNSGKHRWVSELKELGLKPTMRIIEECDDTIWMERERYWIEYYRQNNASLLNITKGGDVNYEYTWKERELNPKAKLNREKVAEIRKLYLEGLPEKQIAASFGVSPSIVQYICYNKKWYDPNYNPTLRREFHIITDEEAKEIRKWHNRGMSRDELMVKFDSSANVIQEIISNKRFPDQNYVRRDGNWNRRHRFSEEEASQIKELRESGYTLKRLCDMFKAEYYTIKYFADGKARKPRGKRTRSHVDYAREST